MKTYREVLLDVMRDQRVTLAAVADALGWKSPRAVAQKLHGQRGWQEGELERMCKFLGITLVQLAARSNDLQVARTPEALEAASIIDRASPAERERLMRMLRADAPRDGRSTKLNRR